MLLQCCHSPVELIRHVLSQHFLCTHHRWWDAAFAAALLEMLLLSAEQRQQRGTKKTARLPMRDSVLYNPFSCLLVKVCTATFPSSLVAAIARAKVAITSPSSINMPLLSPRWHSSLTTTGSLSGLPAQVALATRENLGKHLPEPFSWFYGQQHQLLPTMDT